MVIEFLSNAKHALSEAEWSVFANRYLTDKEPPKLAEGSSEDLERQNILRKLRGGLAHVEG
jgi:hypothetical protein